ncbi:MAG: RluA family pseudouridine synthase [Pirellulaceae bacterium]
MADELSFEPVEVVVPEEANKTRIDAFLAEQFDAYSRTLLRRAITEQSVTVDGHPIKASFKLRPGQRISIRLPELKPDGPEPENIPLDILFEDQFIVVVNKPAAMVVHPARGNWKGTLASALSYHFDELSQVAGTTRPGIVHRLDRDTTGVIMIAKTDAAHVSMMNQFAARTVVKSYLAIVCGRPSRDAEAVDAPIGRHPYQREKMTIRSNHSTSRKAKTVFHVKERFGKHSLLMAQPKTGRTHQIRVHAAHIGHAVLCDRLYGGRSRISRSELSGGPSCDDYVLERQALHAWRLEIRHPRTDELLAFEAPIPDDLNQTLQILRES